MCPKRENVTNLAAHTHRPEISTPIVQIYRECSTNCSIRFMATASFAEIELSFAVFYLLETSAFKSPIIEPLP